MSRTLGELKMRPSFQFRFDDEAQRSAVAGRVPGEAKSVNQWIADAIRLRLGDAQVPESSEIGRKAVVPKRVKAKAETPAKASGLCPHGYDPKTCRLGECPGRRTKC